MKTETRFTIAQLRKLPVFNRLEEADIREILDLGDVVRILSYEPGEKLIIEDKLDRRMFLTMKGQVKVTRDVIFENCKRCKDIKTITGGGHFLGEVSALTGRPRTASVTAVTETICAVFDTGKLLQSASQVMERVKAKLYPELFELVCKRLGETDERMVKLQHKSELADQKITRLQRDKIEMKTKQQEELRKRHLKIRSLEQELKDLKKGRKLLT